VAKRKSELERHSTKYADTMKRAREALRAGLLREAVQIALSAWVHVDGMMQYRRRYEEEEFDSIEAIDLVLKYAPIIFDHRTLDLLEEMLATERRIERNTAADMGQKLILARTQMWEARRLWDYVESRPDVRQHELREALGGTQTTWRSIAESWQGMGLLRRTKDGGSYRLSLVTRLGQVVSAKCPSCGQVAKAPKAIWLEPTECTHCHSQSMFVIGATHDVSKES